MNLSQELRLQLRENPASKTETKAGAVSSWFLCLTVPLTSVSTLGRCCLFCFATCKAVFSSLSLLRLYVEVIILCRELSLLKEPRDSKSGRS